jgi:hypothetical protein
MHIEMQAALSVKCLSLFQILAETGTCQRTLVKFPNIKFHKNSFRATWVVTYEQMESHVEGKRYSLQNFTGNMPKKMSNHSKGLVANGKIKLTLKLRILKYEKMD